MLRGWNPASTGVANLAVLAPAIDLPCRIALGGIVEVSTRTMAVPRAHW